MCQGLEAPEPPRWFFSVSTGACVQQPPSLRNATFKILGYKVGTTLNCDCQRGFRRDPSSGPYMICRGNSSHSFWENKCQCMPTCKCRVYNCPPPEGKKNCSKEGEGVSAFTHSALQTKVCQPHLRDNKCLWFTKQIFNQRLLVLRTVLDTGDSALKEPRLQGEGQISHQ